MSHPDFKNQNRIEEEVPLIPLEEDEVEEPIPKNHDSARLSVVAMIGLLCIFIFLISTVLFASLYLKLLRGNSNKIPPWPKPSPSVLGEYSTAAVAADNEICSDIGRDTLLHGGNAVDAAIATLFCIGVMDTQSAGLGGGHFMTIYNATTKTCHVVDAREVAPLAAFQDMYKDKWNNSKYGWEAIAVPGELHGLWTEYKHFGGKIPWENIIQPTIDILAEGPPTSHHLAGSLKHFEKEILAEPTMQKYINPKTKQVFKVGEQIRTRDNFKNTLQRLAKAKDPVELFYKGDMMKEMVKEFKKHADGRHICGPPPPSGSAVTQAILNILDGYKLSNLTTFDDFTTLFHRFIEASKFAYGARSALGDMDFIKNSSDIARYITNAKWAEEIRQLLTDKTHPDDYYGGHFHVPFDHGTTSISVIDKKGNAVAVTSTINLILGALVSSEATGILWNDEMDDFSIPGHPNYFGFPPTPANFIQPGKRPMSSMAPIVIFNDNNRELLAVGGSGGSTIISGVANVALHSLWLKNDIKEAVDFPRFHNQLHPNVTVVERRMPERYVSALKEHGHTFKTADNYTTITAVHRAMDGQIYANSDFRKGSESEPSGY
uniref:Gamma-glutamyltransferase n=1 Tax=Panagrolaimus superbus TaxID=310955 RepID=A0A914Z2Q9_9BILA